MKEQHTGRGRTAGRILLLLYMACVAYFLLFSESYGRTDVVDGYRYNLVLFREIRRFWVYRDVLGTAAVLLNLVGNVAAFIPYGFALPLLFDRMKNGFLTVAACFATSLAAETIQLVSKVGSFDVDDLLLNTLGGLSGFIIFLIFQKLRGKKRGKEGI